MLTQLTNSASGAIQSWSTYAYDPLMRLAVIDSSNSGLDASLGYDGQEIVLEALSGNRTRRYVHGPGTDEPLVAYLVTATGTSRSWYSADERGSTLRQTNDAGTPTGGLGRYDEYGVGPGTSRFQYTGQYWLGDKNLHYYRARVYDPKLGRFLQPDPIGYEAGMNLYAYVRGDPVNASDPSGTSPFTPNRAEWIDNDEEWAGQKGINLIAAAGGHSRDRMGMWDIVRMAGGRYESLAFERQQRMAGFLIVPTLRDLLEALLGPDEITSAPRALSTSDLGVTINGTVVVEGTIRRDVNSLDIYIFTLFAKGHTGNVVFQGLDVAIDKARSMGLDNVRITAPVSNPQLRHFLASIVVNRYGARTYGQSGSGPSLTIVEIPVR